MTKKDLIVEYYPDESFMVADGFDDAIIGICERTNRVIYSTKKVLEILVEEGMEYGDALDHFSYNVAGSYMGEMTPDRKSVV